MTEKLQLIEMSPEQLKELLLKGVIERLDRLENQLQPKEPTEFLSVQDASELLQVDRSSLYNWKNRGLIQFYGIGNRVYLKRSELEQAVIPINNSPKNQTQF
jgi:excisionase family DNA binding protein